MLDHQNHQNHTYTQTLDAQRFHTSPLGYYRLVKIGTKFLVTFQYSVKSLLKRKHLLFKQ